MIISLYSLIINLDYILFFYLYDFSYISLTYFLLIVLFLEFWQITSLKSLDLVDLERNSDKFGRVDLSQNFAEFGRVD